MEICSQNNSLMTTIKLTAEDFKTKVLDYTTQQEWNYLGTLPAIIDFYADWCGPCKMVAPVLEELAKEYEGKALIGKVNVDHNPNISMQFGIRNIPALLYFKNGQVVDKQIGVVPKSILAGKLDAQLQ